MEASESPRLSAATSGFVLAAAVTVLINTVLACVKDANAPLKAFMRSLAGHDWTAQGIADLALFVGLGLIFMKTGAGEKMSPERLNGFLIGAVAVAGFGLALWYAFF